jgi:hypothetical protein
MSKGPGRRQRLILDELRRRERFYLADLLSAGFSRAEYNALHRAALKLNDAGKCDVFVYMCGPRRVVCMRPGVGQPADRDTLDGHPEEIVIEGKCWKDYSEEAFQHLEK